MCTGRGASRGLCAQASPTGYTTLAQASTMTVEVKKSKFIVTAWPVASPSHAMEVMTAASDPSATHNCWAFQSPGTDAATHNCWADQVGQEFRSSDDGEAHTHTHTHRLGKSSAHLTMASRAAQLGDRSYQHCRGMRELLREEFAEQRDLIREEFSRGMAALAARVTETEARVAGVIAAVATLDARITSKFAQADVAFGPLLRLVPELSVAKDGVADLDERMGRMEKHEVLVLAQFHVDQGKSREMAAKVAALTEQGEGLDHTAVLVTRHFGGIKLGTGGLARAYGAAARDCLRASPRAFRAARVELEVAVPYAILGVMYPQMERVGAVRSGEEEYLEDGRVRLALCVEADREEEFVRAVADATAGGVVPRRIGTDG
ncbi:hypothetical protein FOA52_013394 [Chlamydomonas sp. UWO 241]|nr:hypothetical protein FOA52_013394 [Chlamydomonas sp. UWO 241]